MNTSASTNEPRYRTLAETLPQLVWVGDAEGKCDYFNARWTEYTGLPFDQLIGFGWRETMHPADRDETCAYWLEALKGTVPYDLDFRLRRKDGEYRWFKTRAVPFPDPDYNEPRWLGTCTDIEEQKQAQALFQASERWLSLILESVRDFALFTTDPGGTITRWNPGAELLFGFSEAEVLGKKGDLIFTPEDRENHIPEKEIKTAAQEGCALDERWHLRKDGSRFFASGAMRAIRDEAGCLLGFTKVARDITERKTQEQQLQRAHDELEKKVAERTARLQDTIQELEGFSYSVSHDMRAPLRAMISYSQMLAEELADSINDEGKVYLERIVTAAQRLDRLVLDVLTYSKIGRGELSLEPIDTETVIRAAIDDNPDFQPPRADVILEKPLPVVLGHEASLMQCVTNFLSNAVKFVPAGTKPVIQIRSELLLGETRLWFEDNGIGVAPSDVDRIFSLFGRVHPTSSYEGTGIGLAIVRKAAQRMNAKVGVESELGGGSRFWIQLKQATHE